MFSWLKGTKSKSKDDEKLRRKAKAIRGTQQRHQEVAKTKKQLQKDLAEKQKLFLQIRKGLFNINDFNSYLASKRSQSLQRRADLCEKYFGERPRNRERLPWQIRPQWGPPQGGDTQATVLLEVQHPGEAAMPCLNEEEIRGGLD